MIQSTVIRKEAQRTPTLDVTFVELSPLAPLSITTAKRSQFNHFNRRSDVLHNLNSKEQGKTAEAHSSAVV